MTIINYICDILCISPSELSKFSATAPHRYKIYEIDKRSGAGKRTIAHPSKELKFIQRLVVDLLEKKLTVHQSAYAYRKGVSIRDNAKVHSRNSYILKMDLKDFFPSITPQLLRECLLKSEINFDEDDFKFLSNILFWKLRRNSPLRLSIGAPSSPLISNFIMLQFDRRMSDFCKSCEIEYSRYADDMSFSTNKKNLLFSVPKVVAENLAAEFGRLLTINSEKTVFSSKAHNRHITGVTLTNNNKVTVGREKKRLISAMIHRYKYGKLDDKQLEILKGQLSFSCFIDINLYEQYEKKYGAELMRSLIRKKVV